MKTPRAHSHDVIFISCVSYRCCVPLAEFFTLSTAKTTSQAAAAKSVKGGFQGSKSEKDALTTEPPIDVDDPVRWVVIVVHIYLCYSGD